MYTSRRSHVCPPPTESDRRSTLTVQTEVDGTEAVLLPVGDLDLQTFRRVRDAGTSLLDRGVRRMVVDCSAIAFIDSTGLATLVELTNLTERLRGRLVLRDPSPILERLLAVTGLHDCLPIDQSASTGDGPRAHFTCTSQVSRPGDR
jgi:stage II sporulation protein AA (anti-sigma F factor antagonist)